MKAKPTFPKLNKGHPLANGLTWGWLLSEGAGKKANDATEYIISGNFVNSPTWVGGDSGSAVRFNGSNQYINGGSTGITPVTSLPFSVLIRFRTTQTTASFQDLWTIGNSASTNNFIVVQQNTTQNLAFALRGNSTTQNTATSTNSYSDGNWHTAIGTADTSGHLNLYVDVRDHSSDSTNTMSFPSGADNVNLGVLERTTFAGYWAGDIQCAITWNRMLSFQEISMLQFDPYIMFRRHQILKSSAAPPTFNAWYARPNAGIIGGGLRI